jgi:hypothetical protein
VTTIAKTTAAPTASRNTADDVDTTRTLLTDSDSATRSFAVLQPSPATSLQHRRSALVVVIVVAILMTLLGL